MLLYVTDVRTTISKVEKLTQLQSNQGASRYWEHDTKYFHIYIQFTAIYLTELLYKTQETRCQKCWSRFNYRDQITMTNNILERGSESRVCGLSPLCWR